MTYESEKLSKEIAHYIHSVAALLCRSMAMEAAIERVFDRHLAFVIEKYLDGETPEYTAEILEPGRPIPKI